MTEPFKPYITEPGVYDIPAADYHRDPVVGGSLSHSGSKKLMPPGCPAMFDAWRTGEPEHKDAFDFGRAAHREVLGAGDEIVVIEGTGKDPNAWRTAADDAAVDEARKAGRTPIKPKDAETVQAMAAALREHPIAASLLDPAAGAPEQTLVWRDEESGVMCRALLDFLRTPVRDQRLVVPDYKSAVEVDPESIQKALKNFGYFTQAAWYTEAAQELGLSTGPPAFVLIFQRKTAPHLVVCAQVMPDDIGRGHERNRMARHLYRWCTEQERWPGYADDRVLPLHLPTWEQYRHDGASERGEFDPRRHTGVLA